MPVDVTVNNIKEMKVLGYVISIQINVCMRERERHLCLWPPTILLDIHLILQTESPHLSIQFILAFPTKQDDQGAVQQTKACK